MNRGRSFEKSPREGSQKSEKNSKAVKDISKYFSKKEWADLGYSEKITYVYMKRNYDIMTDLGLKATLPTFMCPKKRATKSNGHDSKDQNPRNQHEPAQEASNMRERKHLQDTGEGRLMSGPTDCGKERTWWSMKRSVIPRKTTNSPQGCDKCP
uniref:KRAB-related domain-containing protein n=1 Tax=Monodon monoceros TaxID=40151 RepID=A0A8C6BG88_MONMO